MVNKKTQRAKRGKGRPTKYRPEFAERAKGLCLLGYTNELLAASFGVSVSTLCSWQTQYPDFLDALNNGREGADSAVANALHEKAKAGDTTAMIFWLKNRMRNNWRDRHEIDSTVKAEITTTTDLSKLTKAELQALIDLLAKTEQAPEKK